VQRATELSERTKVQHLNSVSRILPNLQAFVAHLLTPQEIGYQMLLQLLSAELTPDLQLRHHTTKLWRTKSLYIQNVGGAGKDQ
jgi:hypothetical protein